MNRQFVVSVVVVFIVAMGLSFVVHGVILAEDYAKLVPNAFRAPKDAEAHFPYMIVAHVVMAIGITWIYRQGRDASPWLGQGVRFGLALVVLATIPNYLIYFAVEQLPGDLVAKQIVLVGIAIVLIGIVTAALNRQPVATGRA